MHILTRMSLSVLIRVLARNWGSAEYDTHQNCYVLAAPIYQELYGYLFLDLKEGNFK